ncbi:helix-turn-helix domain-containing protein [Enterococcus sp. 669A]|uniref:Helix-turn-helix domain-containing protein n=1 Tax=Candidatus Enterococcus moelleringii TaxID=2815325 RepID=A0ABS3L8G2_9ENTE|nr:helix-turn-helix domain-containing protein [Enterococcus sp. 669A]MBO1305897.1 helix-turn-helix domain-containing protein [Enterococcus sp. 669A]
MNKILILTKNILAEQGLQKQLQQLNYEVFCSAEIYRNPQLYPIFQFFPIIMLSETISNYEVEKFLTLTEAENNLIVRLSMTEPTGEEQMKWEEIGLPGGLIKASTLDGIREKLVLLQSVYYGTKLEKESQECPPIQKIENRSLETSSGRVYFSKKEEKLFKLLLESKEELIARDQICSILWPEGETDSNRSQLSCIASKIKRKFKEAGYEGETIITKWGQGYGLDPNFYHYLSTGRVDDDFPEYLNVEKKVVSVTI